MPTYDYICRACEHEFELFQSMKDAPKKKCPDCGKLKLERLIGTGTGVIFKGGGFYETDYRSDSYKKAAEAEKKSTEPKKDDAKPSGEKKSEPAPTKSKTKASSSEKKSA
ncbi:MAG: zinc ribbon domain-containing protein [Phycisphaerales bacterium]